MADNLLEEKKNWFLNQPVVVWVILIILVVGAIRTSISDIHAIMEIVSKRSEQSSYQSLSRALGEQQARKLSTTVTQLASTDDEAAMMIANWLILWNETRQDALNINTNVAETIGSGNIESAREMLKTLCDESIRQDRGFRKELDLLAKVETLLLNDNLGDLINTGYDFSKPLTKKEGKLLLSAIKNDPFWKYLISYSSRKPYSSTVSMISFKSHSIATNSSMYIFGNAFPEKKTLKNLVSAVDFPAGTKIFRWDATFQSNELLGIAISSNNAVVWSNPDAPLRVCDAYTIVLPNKTRNKEVQFFIHGMVVTYFDYKVSLVSGNNYVMYMDGLSRKLTESNLLDVLDVGDSVHFFRDEWWVHERIIGKEGRKAWSPGTTTIENYEPFVITCSTPHVWTQSSSKDRISRKIFYGRKY